MKVVFVAPNLNIGGVERQWSVLLPLLVARGATVEAVTLDGRGPVLRRARLERDTGQVPGCLRIVADRSGTASGSER